VAPRSTNTNLLNQFLTEFVVIYLIEAKTPTQTEGGEYIEVPMIVEGVVWDYDEDWLLLGDDRKVQFTLINRDLIAKMDIVDREAELLNDPNKPEIENMN